MENKEINIICEFPSDWCNSKIKNFEKMIIKPLKEKGYKINLKLNEAYSPAKPYYIFVEYAGIKTIIFSNNKNKHENEGALIGNKIDNSNKDQVLDRILRII